MLIAWTITTIREFLSTLSLRRATSGHTKACGKGLISIHALLAESDAPGLSVSLSVSKFLSTLSLRRATIVYDSGFDASRFLSTLSLRRATDRATAQFLIRRNFYPRSPCGERRAMPLEPWFVDQISIHALLAESDFSRLNVSPFGNIFLSTLSLRRATSSRQCSPRNTQNFYPRSPCGERHFTFTADTKQKQFLSTLSLRRATEVVVQRVVESGISIHALLAESDALVVGA